MRGMTSHTRHEDNARDRIILARLADVGRCKVGRRRGEGDR